MNLFFDWILAKIAANFPLIYANWSSILHQMIFEDESEKVSKKNQFHNWQESKIYPTLTTTTQTILRKFAADSTENLFLPFKTL